jgi:hypothetical protein
MTTSADLVRLRAVLRAPGLRLPISYRDLALALHLRPPRLIAQVTALLEASMREDVAAARSLLAAVVVSRHGEPLPRPGYFALAVTLGRFPAEPAWHRRFHRTEWFGVHEPVFDAYRRARYPLAAPGGTIELVPDRGSPALRELLRAEGVGTAALITACNPRSVRLPEAENARRMRALRAHPALRALPLLDALGTDPAGHWPAEPSVMILGPRFGQAVAIAHHFGQNAMLWVDAAGCPRLVETRTPAADDRHDGGGGAPSVVS